MGKSKRKETTTEPHAGSTTEEEPEPGAAFDAAAKGLNKGDTLTLGREMAMKLADMEKRAVAAETENKSKRSKLGEDGEEGSDAAEHDEKDDNVEAEETAVEPTRSRRASASITKSKIGERASKAASKQKDDDDTLAFNEWKKSRSKAGPVVAAAPTIVLMKDDDDAIAK